MDNNVKIRQQASNHGYIKGSPKGAGHGGFVIDSQAKLTGPEILRRVFSVGKIPHVKDDDGSSYVVKDFLAGDMIQGAHICPIKVSKAKNDGNATSLNDIISSIDNLVLKDLKLVGMFDSDQDALNNFLLSTKNESFESQSKFDNNINNYFKKLID